MNKKKSTFLKKTGQLVHVLNWTGQDSKPWPQGYTQIFRPFLKGEGTRTEARGEVMIVREDSLMEKSFEG